MKKYYAIKRGRNTGIFTDLNYVQLQVYKYKNAKFKGFKFKEDALKFLLNSSHRNEINISDDFFDAVAYTDGSYNKQYNIFTFGAVILHNKQKIEFFEKFNNHKWLKLQNTAGEIMGVVKVIDFCLKNKIKSILIYYDYKNLELWLNKNAKIKKHEIFLYREYVEYAKENLLMKFEWVKSHNNDKYNELADCLANKAYELNQFSSVLLK